jgi:hypothetical protein
MSDLEKLRKTVETNFRLNALQTRELGIEVNQQLAVMGESLGGMGEKVDSVASRLDSVTTQLKSVTSQLGTVTLGLKALDAKVHRLGQTFQNSMSEQADRSQETLSVITQILDNSVDLHKTTADHERRIRNLEDRAS